MVVGKEVQMIIGIDPGTEESGFVAYDFERRKLFDSGTLINECIVSTVPSMLKYIPYAMKETRCMLSIEMPENFGMVVGYHVFETLFFIGRLYQKILDHSIPRESIHRITRGNIKYAVIGKRGCKDGDIRQAMINRYGDTLKKTAKTYKLKGHEWQAFAAAEALWLKLKEEA
jgi:hypothetical protein